MPLSLSLSPLLARCPLFLYAPLISVLRPPLFHWSCALPFSLSPAYAEPPRRCTTTHSVGMVVQQWVQGEPTIAQLMRFLGFA